MNPREKKEGSVLTGKCKPCLGPNQKVLEKEKKGGRNKKKKGQPLTDWL